MVLKPRAAVGITVLQHYTGLLEWGVHGPALGLAFCGFAILPAGWELPSVPPRPCLLIFSGFFSMALFFRLTILLLILSLMWSMFAPSRVWTSAMRSQIKSLKKNFIEIQLIYKLLVLGVQKSDSVLYVMYIYVCMFLFFFRFFSILSYCKILSIVPCALHQIFVGYLLCI